MAASSVLKITSVLTVLSYYFIWVRLVYPLKMITPFFSVIQFVLFVFACVLNPGIPKADLQMKKDRTELEYCYKCDYWNYKCTNTFHCPVCNICIEGNNI